MKEELQLSDELSFVTENYSGIIKKYLNPGNIDSQKNFIPIAISFFASSEKYVDKVTPIKEPILKYGAFIVSIYQDFSIENDILTDCNLCEIGDIKFLKIITPFTRERTYDFLVARKEDMEYLLKELHMRKEKANFVSNNTPIIGIDFDILKKETIDFLLNEEFREFCVKHRIPLKRGVVIEGKPGVGKCSRKDVKIRVRISEDLYNAIQKNRKKV